MLMFELRSTDVELLSETVDMITDEADSCWGIELSWDETKDGEVLVAKVEMPELAIVGQVIDMISDTPFEAGMFDRESAVGTQNEIRIYTSKE